MSSMPIGRLAKLTAVKVTTIRFYESIGLLPVAVRAQNTRRIYDEATVRRLSFIKHARQLGFSVEAIRDLLDLADRPGQACDRANAIARAQLEAVEAKIAQLKTLRKELLRMVSPGCSGPAAACHVIESLADHSLCASDHV